MIAWLAAVAFAQDFPAVAARPVAGPEVALPAALPDGGVVAVAFARSQSDALASWEAPLARVPHEAVLVMGEVDGWLQGTIRVAMRAGLPAERAARTLLLWGDPAAFLAALGDPAREDLLVLRVDGDGRIVARTAGAYAPERAVALGLPQ